MDLLPSSGEPTLWDHSETGKLNHWSSCFVFSSIWNSRQWTKPRAPVILSVIHHYQNLLYSITYLSLKFNYPETTIEIIAYKLQFKEIRFHILLLTTHFLRFPLGHETKFHDHITGTNYSIIYFHA
jgi:hypothetical protein